ncbi:S8 family serine peptidase [Paenibacillus macerans]|uniref:S8 family serine peptidase n=1 Tax=Paenibacillus macerans TaxID=44252 RepID=A0A6N8EZB8_PAEMA|nr:S8 family serine peptidase [Paenibacillus macerans]
MPKSAPQAAQPLKIAIIDSGINGQWFDLHSFEREIEIDSELQTVEETEAGPQSIHGTLCAAIIEKYSKYKQIYSVKILNERGKATSKQLAAAITWCIENDIKIINMSVGSTDRQDYDLIKQVVNQAYNKGIIIIAAASNRGDMTYPAAFSNTIGVKCDRNHILNFSQYIYDCSSLDGTEVIANGRHRLTNRLGDTIATDASNSYAAPLVTALVSNMLYHQPTLTLQELKYKLMDSSTLVLGGPKTLIKNCKDLDWIQGAIVYVLENSEQTYNVQHYCFNVYDIVKFNLDKVCKSSFKNSIKDQILKDLKAFEEADTLIFVSTVYGEKAICWERVLDTQWLKYCIKNIVIIDDNRGPSQQEESRGDINIWHPSYHKKYDMVQPSISNDISVPIVAVYDFIGFGLNDLVYELAEKFRSNDYAVTAIMNTGLGVVSGHEYISTQDLLDPNGGLQLHPIQSLEALYKPDVIIVGIEDRHTTNNMLCLIKGSSADANIFLVDRFRTEDSENFRLDSCNVILTKEQNGFPIECKGWRSLHFNGEKSLAAAYSYLFKMLQEE